MKPVNLLLSGLLMLGLLGAAGPGRALAAPANELHVCSSGCAYSTVQAAVTAAASGDTIKVAAGAYHGVSTVGSHTQMVYITKNITLLGGFTPSNWTAANPATNVTLLDAQQLGHVFTVNGAYQATIDGFSITGGKTLDGVSDSGGIYVYDGRLILSHSKVYGNTADLDGGGIYMLRSSMSALPNSSFTSNEIYSNTAGDMGGGVMLDAADTVTFTGNNIHDNTATNGDGGGVYLDHCPNAAFSQDLFNANHADSGSGGGLAIWGYGSGGTNQTLTGDVVSGNSASHGGGMNFDTTAYILNQVTVTGNTSAHDGGGLATYATLGTINGGVFGNNTSNGSDGGLFLQLSGASISGATVINNHATRSYPASWGGGIYFYNEDLNRDATFVQNTITGNTATGRGGGVAIDGGYKVLLRANQITGNTTSTLGGGLSIYGDPTVSGSYLYNTLQSNSAATGGGISVEQQQNRTALSFNRVVSNTGGGGVYLQGGTPSLDGTTVKGNAGNGVMLAVSNAVLKNTLVADNTCANHGCGISVGGGSPQFLHITVAHNTGGDGSGIYINYGQSGENVNASFTNTLVGGQTIGVKMNSPVTLTLNTTLWANGAWLNSSEVVDPGGNTLARSGDVRGDAAFVNGAAGNYHIQSTSAAHDHGVNASVTDDVDGDVRPCGAPDIGADEWGPKQYLPLAEK